MVGELHTSMELTCLFTGIRTVMAAHSTEYLLIALKMKSESLGTLWNQWNLGQGKNWHLLCITDNFISQMRKQDQRVFLQRCSVSLQMASLKQKYVYQFESSRLLIETEF